MPTICPICNKVDVGTFDPREAPKPIAIARCVPACEPKPKEEK